MSDFFEPGKVIIQRQGIGDWEEVELGSVKAGDVRRGDDGVLWRAAQDAYKSSPLDGWQVRWESV